MIRGQTPEQHRMVHPYGIQGCPQCRQPAQCHWCEGTQAECPDWEGHGTLHHSSEITQWRAAA